MSVSVFLSHTAADKPFVRKLAQDLDNHGVKYWLDEAEIKVGESLIEKIRQGLDQVDYVAVILSPNSIASPWVQREVDVAINQEIHGKKVRVLPIMYRHCELPGFLLGKFYADFSEESKYTEAFKRLVGSIGVVFNRGALDPSSANSSLQDAINRALRLNLPLLSTPFHRPFPCWICTSSKYGQGKERLLDFQEFKDTVERVATAADRTYGEVRPFLSTS